MKTSTNSAKSKRRYLQSVSIALPLFLFALFGGATLGWPSIWTDEIFTLKALQLPISRMVLERGEAGHPPLFFLLERCFKFSSERHVEILWLRFPPFFFGIIDILLIYRISCLVAPVRVALSNALVTSILPVHLFVSQMARAYTLNTCLELLTVLVLVTAAVRQNPASRAQCALVFATSMMASLTHASSFPIGLAIFIAVQVAAPSIQRLSLYLVAGHSVGLCYYLISCAQGLSGGHVAWIPPATLLDFISYPSSIFLGKMWFYQTTFFSAASSCLLLIFILHELQSKGPVGILAWHVWIAWLLAGLLTLCGINVLVIERYWTTTGLILLVVIGCAAGRSIDAHWHRVFTITSFACVFLVGTIPYLLAPVFTPWHEIADFIQNQEIASDKIIIDANSNRSVPDYYFHREITSLSSLQVVQWLRSNASPKSYRLWICTEDGRTSDAFLTEMRGKFVTYAKYNFGNARVMLFLVDQQNYMSTSNQN